MIRHIEPCGPPDKTFWNAQLLLIKSDLKFGRDEI